MTEAASTKTLEAKCFCGAVHFTIDAPLSRLPFRAHLCHCSLCRYATGAPCVFHTPLREIKPNFIAPSSPANMTSYVGEGFGCLSDFCSTCGCHIAMIENGNWVVSTSIFTDHSPEVFQINRHIFSKSAKDGGIAQFATRVGDREMIDWNPPPEDPRSAVVQSQPEVDADGQERLRAKCHCGGVSFTVGRPTQEVIDDEFAGQFVSPLDKTKWLATLDACDDCRLTTGTHMIGWTFLPLSACDPPIKSDLKIGTSKTFVSSAGVLRSFCGTCGASVFFSCDERRPDGKRQVVDLATGVLRAPEGPMAENWLEWRSKIAWASSGKKFDGDFVEGVQEGINKWVVAKHGKELTFSIG